MKISITLGFILLSGSAGFVAQAQNISSQPVQTGQGGLPSPTAYAIVDKDANSSVWQRTVYEQDPSGKPVPKIHRYTEVATGLHYWQNGQWLDSQEVISILPNGTAAATNGQHQVYFPGDIYDGEIELVTPDGLHLRSQPLGLTYFDGTNTVMIASLTNSIGVVVGENQVVYPNAFTGIGADLRYTYTKAGFEQDVILHQQPLTPESYGLNADTARLQMMTEFVAPVQPAVQSGVLPAQAGLALADQSLNFGTMQMASGRAFMLGQNAQNATAMVAKHWVVVQGRQILIEEVPVNAIVPGLAALPLAVVPVTQPAPVAWRKFELPPQRIVKHNPNTKMLLSKVDMPVQGFVLDYQTLNSSQTNYTFQGDTTYYISGTVNLFGTNTFEGGAVIKYTNNASLNFSYPAKVNCLTAAYRPVVFTARDDNSVGETISGSTGNPTYAANPALNFTASFGNTYSNFVSNFRICWAKEAIGGSVTSSAFYNGQLVNCLNGVNWQYVTFYGRNLLFASVLTNFTLTAGGINLQNTTISGSACFEVTSSGGGLNAYNCIFADITNLQSGGSFSFSGSNNGFYNSTNFGSSTVTNTFYPFQAVGAGDYYLTNGCNFFNVGTTNIDPVLLASLQQKTTYPPIVYSNVSISVPTTLSPQAQRDTGIPDLGYHYDPLDYAFSGVQVLSPGSVTFNAGTAVAWFSPYVSNTPGWEVGTASGLAMSNSAAVTFNGTATAPCRFASYDSVQEGCTAVWMPGYLGGIANRGAKDYTTPATLTARFTHFSHLSFDVNHFRDGESGQPLVVRASHCEFLGGFGGYNLLGTYTNCLFDRVAFAQSTGDTNPYAIFINATFHGGSVQFTHWEDDYQGGPPYWYSYVHNCAFDGTTFSIDDPFGVNTNFADYDFNAYLLGAPQMSPEGTDNVVVTNSFNWQASWFGSYYQPTNSLLIDMGDRTADQLGLYHFTTQTNQTVEANSTVDIGYHYVATDAYGNPLDTNGDGVPDYLEDANGNGLVDGAETPWNLAILSQPQNLTVPAGTNAAFSVTVGGTSPFYYQWRFNGTNIAGATNYSYTISPATPTNAGTYSVIVSNLSTTLTSSNAILTVTGPWIGLSSSSINYTNGAAPEIIDGGALVLSATNCSSFTNSVLTVTVITNAQPEDDLAIFNQGTSANQIGVTNNLIRFWGTNIATFSGGRGSNALVIAFTNNPVVTPAMVQAVVRNINYHYYPSSTNDSDLPRTVQFSLTDGKNQTNYPATKTIYLDCPSALNVMFVMDCSGSMGDPLGGTNSKISVARSTAISFINSMQFPGDQVGLVWFQTVPHNAFGLTNNPDYVISTINSLTAANSTDTGDAISNALTDISAPPTNSGLPLVILMTDGVPNLPTSGLGATNWMVLQAAKIRQAGVRLVIIGLGTNGNYQDFNPILLTNIASSVDDIYVSTNTANLASIYTNIAYSLCRQLATNANSGLTVNLTAPTNNQTLLVGSSFTLNATATNPTPDVSISWVEFFSGTNSLGVLFWPSNGVYTLNWTPPYGGTNVFKAYAQDSLGSNAWSTPVTAYVRNLPLITITSPTNGQTFAMISPQISTNITLNVTATPDRATISKVIFYQGTNAIGTNSFSPFEMTWNGITNGTYTLTAQATDSTGLTGVSFPVVITVHATNLPPVVYAGPDQTTNLPNAVVQLTGFASDDGLPSNYLAVTWSKIDGPGNVVFGNSTQQVTTAVFTNIGTYHLQLAATDGQLSSFSSNTITVLASNAPPYVNAGPSQTLTNNSLGEFTPISAVLSGVVTDDGNPVGGTLIINWSMVTGPAPITFANDNATNTFAVFTQPGTYKLQLTAYDGQLTSSSNVTITVVSPDVITYGASGYLYTYPAYAEGDDDGFGTTNPIPNYYATNFDDSQWTNGQAGFGDRAFLAPDPNACPLNNSNFVKTYWPSETNFYYYPYLYLRKHFTVPPGTTNLCMGFTVDNDAQIYINGNLICPSNVTYISTINGYYLTDVNFFYHTSCPNPDDLILDGISTNIWHTNDNLLAVCAYNSEAASEAYYDNHIGFNTWFTTTNLPDGANQPPLVYAGWNQFVVLSTNGYSGPSATILLNGLIMDDGLPGLGGALAMWTNISSGSSAVTFGPTNENSNNYGQNYITYPFTNYLAATATATFTSSGIYQFQLVANDGALGTTGSISVVVINPSDLTYVAPPAVTITSPINGASYALGDTIPLAASASASSGSIVTQVQFFASSSASSRILVGHANTNPFTANWNNLIAGNYALVAQATDNSGRVGYSTNQVNIQISAIINHPPVANNDQVTVLANSINNPIYALANDIDNDPLIITALTSKGVTASSITTYNGGTATIINNGQAINYTPPPGVQGGDGFTYYISDGKGGTASAGIVITIYASAQPSISLVPTTGVTNAGALDPLIATVSPFQNITRVDFYQGTMLLGTVTNGSGGTYTLNWTAIYNPCGCGFTAQATDIFGQVNTSEETNVIVTTSGLSGTLVADLDSIVDTNGTMNLNADNLDTIRDGIFNLYGRANHSLGSNAVWQLGVYTVDGSTLLRNLTPSSTSSVGSGTVSNILTTCDLTTLINGVYELRLTVTGGYQVTNVAVQFRLESNLKLGQFSFSQQDLAIPLTGIPLTVTRTYNSINPDKDDFGYGWTYSLGSMDVSLDETRANAFDLAGDDGDDSPSGTFSMRNGGGYDVTLNLPNGQRTTFYFQLSSPDANNNCRPQWLAAPGVTATLGVQGNPLYNLGEGGSPGWNEGDNGSEGVPFNNMDFEGFVLTNQDGTLYYINRDDMGSHSPGGDWLVETYGPPYLARIVQRSGDTITINPNSIVHVYSNGVATQIEFQRNADGLISSISDPSGLNSDGTTNGPAAVQYIYDNKDNLISVLNLVDRDGSGTYVTNTFSYTNANFPHFITGIINADGTPVAKNIYDDSGKLVEVDDANGNRTLFNSNTTNNTQTVVDRMGNTNTYVYDLRGNVLAQTNALGQVTTMAYDLNNNKTNEVAYLNGQPYATNSYVYDTNLNLMLSSTDPLGHASTFAYDSYGELTNSTDANHNLTVNTYDGGGNLTRTVDALNNSTVNNYSGSLPTGSMDAIGTTTANSYDTFENLAGTITLDAAGAVLSTNSFTYDDNGNRLTSTVWRKVNGSWVGATTAYIYDAQNRVVQTIDPDGGTNTVVYDPTGKQQFTIDPLGNTNSYAYDAQGRLIQTTYPDGTTETNGYDANGNRVASADRLNRVTTYVYDALNRLTQTVYADGTTNTTVYDDVGRAAQTIDARGTITAFAYDPAGRRLAVTNAFGTAVQNISSYGYDANGNQITFTDANTHTTTNVFDALNRQVQVQYPDGTKTATAYDADGRSVAQTNQDGLVTLFGYDGAERLIAVTNALNQVTRYNYDEAGNEVAQIDALGRTNSFIFDGMGRRVAHLMPTNALVERFSYDLAGNLILDTNFNGVVIVNQYDVMNRLTNRTTAGGYNASYTYTPTGQRATMVDASGTTSYGYDSRDRLTLKTIKSLFWDNLGLYETLNYTYDANGNLTKLWSYTTDYIEEVTNVYQYDALNRLTNVLANGSAAAGYAYDAAGNLQGMRYGNGVTNLYQYDSLNRLTNQVWKYNSSPRAGFYYQLGVSGNRTNLSETVSGTSRSYAWSYDHLYRLTNETISGLGSLGYQYDSVGNRTNRMVGGSLSLTNQSFTYTTNDWLTSDDYDNNGNTTASGVNSYQYDVMNHVTNANDTVYITYDGDGNRVDKTVGGVTTFYLVDDRNPGGYAQVMEEWTYDSSSGNVTLKVYNYGLSLISQQQYDFDTDTTTNVVYYGLDGHGSVRFLMDTNGSVTDTYIYDAFGNVIASSGSTANNILYCGEYRDPDLGMIYLRNRWEITGTGRFLTSDGDGYGNNEDPLSLHKYLYGADDPVNRLDPSGHDDIGDVLGAMDISAGLDALPGLSITPKGAVSTGSTCGPDVTAAVLNTTLDIEHTFLNAPFSVQAQAVNNIYTPAIGDGWDIEPLMQLGFHIPQDFGNGSVAGTGIGADTVQYGFPPKVYYAGSLNYILWGQMFALAAAKFANPITGTGDPAYSETTAEAAAWTYKSVFWRDFGDKKREALAFVHYGYDGTDPSGTALPLAPNPKNVGASARFKWKWIGLHDEAE